MADWKKLMKAQKEWDERQKRGLLALGGKSLPEKKKKKRKSK